jgi:hypothetical protein
MKKRQPRRYLRIEHDYRTNESWLCGHDGKKIQKLSFNPFEPIEIAMAREVRELVKNGMERKS